MSRVAEGEMVEWSTTIKPSRAAEATPSSPSSTLFDVRGVGDADEDDVGRRGGGGGGVGPGGAALEQGFGAGAGAGVDGEGVAGGEQVAGHGGAHDAGADECELRASACVADMRVMKPGSIQIKTSPLRGKHGKIRSTEPGSRLHGACERFSFPCGPVRLHSDDAGFPRSSDGRYSPATPRTADHDQDTSNAGVAAAATRNAGASSEAAADGGRCPPSCRWIPAFSSWSRLTARRAWIGALAGPDGPQVLQHRLRAGVAVLPLLGHRHFDDLRHPGRQGGVHVVGGRPAAP